MIYHDVVGPVCSPQLVEHRQLPMCAADVLALPLACAQTWRDDWAAWAAAGVPGPDLSNLTAYESRAYMFDAALSGQAVILADARMTAADEKAGRLVSLCADNVERPHGIYVVSRRRSTDPRLVKFTRWLQQTAAERTGAKP